MSLETTAGLNRLTEDMAVVTIDNSKPPIEGGIQKEEDECYDTNESTSNDSVTSVVLQSQEKLCKAACKKNNHHVATNLPFRRTGNRSHAEKSETDDSSETDNNAPSSSRSDVAKLSDELEDSNALANKFHGIAFEESTGDEKPSVSRSSDVSPPTDTVFQKPCDSVSEEKLDESLTLENTEVPNAKIDLNCSGKGKKRKSRRKKRFRFGVGNRKSPVKPPQPAISAEENSSFHRPNFINTVVMGDYEMDTWYWSPYPNECVSSGCIFICEKCLELKRSKETLQSHTVRCKAVYPPGDEIFRQDDISVFEVDGEKAKLYCQHLCMLGKLFIDHKALFYDVEPFLFYVVSLCDLSGVHFVGYFSKQKYSEEKHNLSCIITLPCYQDRGFGRFLIDFSFLLTRRENVLGSAEKPLSELGHIAYRSYWRTAILEFLHKKLETNGHFENLSIDEIGRATGIEHADILQTLNDLEMLTLDNDTIFLEINLTAVSKHWEKVKMDPRRIWIDEKNLQWEPKIYERPVDDEVG